MFECQMMKDVAGNAINSCRSIAGHSLNDGSDLFRSDDNFVFFFVFCGFVYFVFFLGRFKGQVRWPKGPPHLALNPPYVFWFFSFVILSLFLIEKPCFPPKKAILVYLSVFPFVSL